MASVDDEMDEMEGMEDVDEMGMDTEEEQTEDDSGSDESMLTEAQFVAEGLSVEITYGEPRLDRLPTKTYYCILSYLGRREIIALRRVCDQIS